MYKKLIKTGKQMRPHWLALLVLLSLGVQTTSASELLGVLVEMTNPESEVAKQLELTDDQREQLKQLSSKRLRAALNLASQLKEAPKSEQSQIKRAFAAESERFAYEILGEAQQGKIAKLRIQWMGLSSLAEDEVAMFVNLADWQKEIVGEWIDTLSEARRENNVDKVKPQADRALRRELSETQWAAWQLLAGQINENAAGPPVPPERKTTDALASTPSPSDKTGQPALTPDQASQMPVDEIKLMLNFQQQPWSVVIKWLAEQADLSVQSEVLPPGTFTYRDLSRKYTVSETLDQMNSALLDSGYTLFRTDRFLRCVNLEEDQKMRGEFIGLVADKISENDLNGPKYGRFEPVTVIFTLQRVSPDAIIDEVEDLLSVQGTVISLQSSGQLKVTDLAGNVRNVAEFIRSAEDPQSARGAGVQSIPLKHINAEEVLAVARPLLELLEGVNVSTTIKISTNTFGTVIYAKGDMDKIQIIKDLVEQMDKAPSDSEKPITYETPFVGRHSVRGLDLQLAYEVISQLLAGAPEVRLAKDEASKQLILQGRKADHELVKNTLDSLAGQASDFQVIQLERLDPQMAIAAVKKFFGLADTADATSGDPVIDGDLMARQIWIKGSEDQVKRIKDLIQELEKNAKATKNIWGSTMRMLPPGGSTADALKQAEQMWAQMYGKQNPIVRETGEVTVPGGLRSRSFAPPRKAKNDGEKEPAAESQPKGQEEPAVQPNEPEVNENKATRNSPFNSAVTPGFLVSQESAGQMAQPPRLSGDGGSKPIIIRDGPAGLMITCEDEEALERFENLLRMIMDQSAMGGDEPEVIYLVNIKANAARDLLMEVLGGASSSGGSSGGLLGDMATSVLGGFGGGMLGNLLGGGGSGTTSASSSGLASGDFSIVADPRLNALFITASGPDKKLIEQILKVIDLPESPFPVETRGVIELIPVVTQDVADVLTTVKTVLGDRIEGNTASRGGGGGGGGQPNPAEIIQAMRSAVGGGGSRRGGGNSELTEPKISVSADTFTNTLIVQAQPQQIEEVRQLVAMIDAAGEGEQEDISVVPIPGGVSATSLSDSLKRILGAKAQTNTTGTTPSSGSSGSSTSSSATSEADAARRRAEFFQGIMQQRGGSPFGGGTAPSSGGSTSGRGGSPFGTGGSPFGGGGDRGGSDRGGRGGR